MSLAQSEVILRRLEWDDGEALAAFYNGLSEASKRTFRPLGTTTTVETCNDIIQDNLAAPPAKFDLVAVDGVAIVGWAFIWGLSGSDTNSEPLFGLGVADSHQHMGIGTRLITAVMTRARAARLPRVVLTVVQDNTIAWRLYEKQGFVRYGEFVGEDGLPYYRMRWDPGAPTAAEGWRPEGTPGQA